MKKRKHHRTSCRAKGLFDDALIGNLARARQRTYHIVRINCDCGSDVVARTSLRWVFGPRCPNCCRVLGPFDYSVVAKIRAVGNLEALRLYGEGSQIANQKAKTKPVLNT